MTYKFVDDFATAQAWLLSGRDKTTRTLYDSSHALHIELITSDAITVFYKTRYNKENVPVITYLSDDTQLLHPDFYKLNRNGNLGTFQKRVIAKYSKYINRVYVKNRNTYVVLNTDPLTESKIRKCKPCFGSGNRESYCGGEPPCREDDCEINIEKAEFYNRIANENLSAAEIKLMNKEIENRTHYHSLCSHGKYAPHHFWDKDSYCWWCNGTGTKEHGQKQIGTVWSGAGYVIITPEGKATDQFPTNITDLLNKIEDPDLRTVKVKTTKEA